jgi:TPP-dependent indolepyruvate ferredoxin oxidoreductase alpha subunit
MEEYMLKSKRQRSKHIIVCAEDPKSTAGLLEPKNEFAWSHANLLFLHPSNGQGEIDL